jgi:microsomal dipeptidase-like Zn-dependent dipeptidase
MLADVHAHYPMHVMQMEPRASLDAMLRLRGRPLRDKLRAVVLRVASRLLSDRDLWSGHRVTLEQMQAGRVGVTFSVLYSPFDELDLSRSYGEPPSDAYFGELMVQIDRVEQEIATHEESAVRVVRDAEALDQALADGAIAIVHCVEGGFHLGDSTEAIEANVAALARRGVAYITLAHLFWREVATNAPALPFLPDSLYRKIFSQPKGEGLTARGEAAVRAMVRNRVLIDVSHMRTDALEETLTLLDQLDDRMPVIASHAGYRFGEQEYMLQPETIEQIGKRDGVVGLIMAHHQLHDGIRKDNTENLEQSFESIRRHIDKIRSLTGSNRHVALGTDLDGFIKPTLGGIESMADLAHLEDLLRREYSDDWEAIASGNAVRVLHSLWRA